MTEDNQGSFPRNLLQASHSARLEYFRAFTTGHPVLLSVYEKLWCAIRDSNPGSIIFVYGPTGVGKTTLLDRTATRCKEMLLAELEKDSERMPVVTVGLPAHSSGIFDWQDYFQRLLLELEEPLIDHKLDRSQWNTRNPHTLVKAESNMQLIFSDKPGIRPIRSASERTLQHRRPLAVLIDNAQHFGIISSGRRLLDQLNVIKSLADESEVTHVLCGTYELIPLRNLNGQISRRSRDIHFGRYHAGDEQQRDEFITALNTFQKQLPLADEPDLISRWDYFYERSLGCVGILKDWLNSSLSQALDSNSSTLPLEYLEQQALSVRQCTNILREIKTSETELKEEGEGASLLREDLGLTEEVVSNERVKISKNVKGLAGVKPTNRKRRVGARKPVRDKIGVEAA